MQIIRAIPILSLVILGVINSDKLSGVIKLEDEMTKEEQQTTGVATLNAAQKEALEKWINDKFTLKTKSSGALPTLQQNMNNGSQLELSDGSIYEIAPSEQAKTLYWLSPVGMEISASNDPMYPYLVKNTLTGVSVRAKLVRGSNK